MPMYQSMDKLPRFLMEKLEPKYISSQKFAIQGQVFWFIFSDFDKDGLADQFVMQSQEGKVLQQDFGFMYDLNGDEKTDYIIYNGGSMITDESPFYIYFYHWIDTDFNGRIDALAYTHVIYSEGSRPDPHRVFWIMDRDGNGSPDFVDVTDNKSNSSYPLEANGGIWSYTTLFGPKTIDSRDSLFFSLYDQYLEAVRVMK